eukprot:1159359-Pelagomonas_calceolata.AAC.11
MPFGWLTVDGKIPSFATFPSNRVCLDNTQPSNTHKCSSGRRSRHHDCDARGSKEGVFAAQVGLEEWMAEWLENSKRRLTYPEKLCVVGKSENRRASYKLRWGLTFSQ